MLPNNQGQTTVQPSTATAALVARTSTAAASVTTSQYSPSTETSLTDDQYLEELTTPTKVFIDAKFIAEFDKKGEVSSQLFSTAVTEGINNRFEFIFLTSAGVNQKLIHLLLNKIKPENFIQTPIIEIVFNNISASEQLRIEECFTSYIPSNHDSKKANSQATSLPAKTKDTKESHSTKYMKNLLWEQRFKVKSKYLPSLITDTIYTKDPKPSNIIWHEKAVYLDGLVSLWNSPPESMKDSFVIVDPNNELEARTTPDAKAIRGLCHLVGANNKLLDFKEAQRLLSEAAAQHNSIAEFIIGLWHQKLPLIAADKKSHANLTDYERIGVENDNNELIMCRWFLRAKGFWPADRAIWLFNLANPQKNADIIALAMASLENYQRMPIGVDTTEEAKKMASQDPYNSLGEPIGTIISTRHATVPQKWKPGYHMYAVYADHVHGITWVKTINFYQTRALAFPIPTYQANLDGNPASLLHSCAISDLGEVNTLDEKFSRKIYYHLNAKINVKNVYPYESAYTNHDDKIHIVLTEYSAESFSSEKPLLIPKLIPNSYFTEDTLSFGLMATDLYFQGRSPIADLCPIAPSHQRTLDENVQYRYLLPFVNRLLVEVKEGRENENCIDAKIDDYLTSCPAPSIFIRNELPKIRYHLNQYLAHILTLGAQFSNSIPTMLLQEMILQYLFDPFLSVPSILSVGNVLRDSTSISGLTVIPYKYEKATEWLNLAFSKWAGRITQQTQRQTEPNTSWPRRVMQAAQALASKGKAEKGLELLADYKQFQTKQKILADIQALIEPLKVDIISYDGNHWNFFYTLRKYISSLQQAKLLRINIANFIFPLREIPSRIYDEYPRDLSLQRCREIISAEESKQQAIDALINLNVYAENGKRVVASSVGFLLLPPPVLPPVQEQSHQTNKLDTHNSQIKK